MPPRLRWFNRAPFTTVLKEPVVLHIKNGAIVEMEGGNETKTYEQWLKSFNHPQMLKLARVAYGLHSNARLSGDIVEDERVWGATGWGIGNVGLFHTAGPIRIERLVRQISTEKITKANIDAKGSFTQISQSQKICKELVIGLWVGILMTCELLNQRKRQKHLAYWLGSGVKNLVASHPNTVKIVLEDNSHALLCKMGSV